MRLLRVLSRWIEYVQRNGFHNLSDTCASVWLSLWWSSFSLNHTVHWVGKEIIIMLIILNEWNYMWRWWSRYLQIVALSLTFLSITFYFLCVLLAFCHLKCAWNLKLLVSSELEIRNVFNKTTFQKSVIINKDVNVVFPCARYWKAYITEAPVLCYFN